MQVRAWEVEAGTEFEAEEHGLRARSQHVGKNEVSKYSRWRKGGPPKGKCLVSRIRKPGRRR